MNIFQKLRRHEKSQITFYGGGSHLLSQRLHAKSKILLIGTHHHNHFISQFHTTKMWLILSKFVLTSLIISSGIQTSITFPNIPHSPLLQLNIIKFINENWKKNFENMILIYTFTLSLKNGRIKLKWFNVFYYFILYII